MALKFLNKKGWHTGSLRNIENVWKAEQKHEAEQKKLEELRKQIQEERERSEFRLLQEQAGLVTKQERLEFLYDSGLAVGKGNSSGGFKALESSSLKTDSGTAPSSATSSSTKQSSVPGALFEEKPQSANDAWRKLHSDPLLLIRQREQEALARVKNNPIQMAMIRKSVEATKNKKKTHDEDDDKAHKRKHHHKKKHEKQSSSGHHSGSENAGSEKKRRKSSGHKGSRSILPSSEEETDWDIERKRISKKSTHKEHGPGFLLESTTKKNVRQQRGKGIQNDFQHEETCSAGYMDPVPMNQGKRERKIPQSNVGDSSDTVRRNEAINRRRNPVELSEEERAARLQEMQMDAELHEEQRWKRLKKAEENDAREAVRAGIPKGSNFLDAVQKSVYGTDKGGSATIEESVRRRTHYLQGRSEATERNAFRR
ncbi:pre-mRNA-splicing factor CWC25 homolog [Coffea eugenioides]|uniref:CBF1-interacting co-repressor CIR N-terminal domain-containing protein n=1 Tax=Coffea arabica TaxID=13443 RepID=A0A6P6U9K7_COFAR|nr:pre-mRNA-splicing factor CWC25 homolog [Coffea eugenioides]